MNKYIKQTHDKIEANTRSINPAAYLKHIDSIYSSMAGPLNGDQRLDRMSALCNVISRHNHVDGLEKCQQSIDLLNQYRSLQGCKPSGFDDLVKEESRCILYLAIEAGFGWNQLREAAYIFEYDVLIENDLLSLRKEKNEQNEVSQ